jgi:hypothetical protein
MMKRIFQIALLIACVLGMATGQPAHAAQFNITIPMNLSKIPAEYNTVFVKGYILCSYATNVGETGDGHGGGIGSNPFNRQVGDEAYGRVIVGTGQSIHPINTATGEFHSSISLGLNVAQGYYPNNVGGYAYIFKLQGPTVEDFVLIGSTRVGGGGSRSELEQQSAMNPRGGGFVNPALVGSHCDSEDFEQ